MKKHRKLSAIILVGILLVGVAACGSKTKTPKDYAAPAVLSAEQQRVLDAVSTDKQEYMLFDFTTESTYKRVEFWVETYENGSLADAKLAAADISYDTARPVSGTLSAIISHNTEYVWTLVYSGSGGKVFQTGEPSEKYLTEAKAYGRLNGAVEIENGKEIILYACVFSEDTAIEAFDIRQFQDARELEKYEYAHVLKCRFSA